MDALKYILTAIGVIAIVLTLLFLIVGFKVVSAVFMYIVGAIAVIAVIGFILYFMWKGSKRD